MKQEIASKPEKRAPHGTSIFHERSCKIVATIGPKSNDLKTLEGLIKKGMNIARLNFSHGDHSFHADNIEKIKKLSQNLGKNVAILQDLQGPKIRCGSLIDDKNKIDEGVHYKLYFGTTQEKLGSIPVDYGQLTTDTNIGDRVLMDDGLLIFEIIKKKDDFIVVKATNSGILKNRKGVNFPDSHISQPSLTEKDTKDLLFGVAKGVDAIALSFVQRAEDVEQCRKIINVLGSDIPIIAKIEKPLAMINIDTIAAVSDGLMVARGDLGIESSIEMVPIYQKKIIATAEKHAIPVIIATQMLESMTHNPEPTLAEMADVANGVLDEADCVMLSGEVAAGDYPEECVEKMASIIDKVETWSYNKGARHKQIGTVKEIWKNHTSITKAASEAADLLNAKAIVCLTLTGSIARLLSKWRPKTTIVAISPRHDVIKRLNFCWGVYAIRNPLFYNTDNLLNQIPELLKSYNIVEKGDTIVITAGIPLKSMCSTNMMQIKKIV